MRRVGVPAAEIGRRWLCKRNEGVFVVRIRGSGGVDHCIVADCRRSVFIDPAESYPVRMNRETLGMAVGKDSSWEGVIEIRELPMRRIRRHVDGGKRRHRSGR